MLVPESAVVLVSEVVDVELRSTEVVLSTAVELSIVAVVLLTNEEHGGRPDAGVVLLPLWWW